MKHNIFAYIFIHGDAMNLAINSHDTTTGFLKPYVQPNSGFRSALISPCREQHHDGLK